jgi:hypothetical protein
MNGSWSDTDKGSTTRWVDKRLLTGEKVFPFAGSDTENTNHFGECYTVVYAEKLSQLNIKNNLALGRHYATTYPGLAMWAKQNGVVTWSWMGDTLTMGSGKAEVYISYADSYDALDIMIMKGKAGWTDEHLLHFQTVSAGSGYFSIIVDVEPGCYLRAYCKEKVDENFRAYSTPIWFN